MARSRVRLLAVLRARSRASHARDVDESELLAVLGRRRGEELPRLGTAARAPLSRTEALVLDSGAGNRRAAGAVASRPGEREVVGVAGASRGELACAGAGFAADRMCAA